MKKNFFITAAVLVISVVAGITLKANIGELQKDLPPVEVTCNSSCKGAGQCWRATDNTDTPAKRCELCGLTYSWCNCN